MHQTKPIEPTWNHCHGARIATSTFRLPLPIILSNKLIVMPVQIFIMNQLTGRFSIGSISRKHFPIWRNNRQAFRNDAGTRVDFFFFLSFLFFEPSNDYSEWTFVIRLQSVIIKSANFRVDSSLESISNVGMKIPFRWKSMMKRDGKKKKKKKKWG